MEQQPSLRVPTIALALLALSFPVVARAGTAGGSPRQLSYDQPTWWPKAEALASMTPRQASAPVSTASVTVGPNVDVSNEPGPQSETSISVNPSDPSQVVADSNDIHRLPLRAYASFDGGASFTGVDLPLPPPLSRNGLAAAGDPGVAWDSSGHVYASYLVFFAGSLSSLHKGLNATQGSEMAVARSSDGGLTWRATFFAFQPGSGRFVDKPMIAVDNNPGSPHFGRIYVTWDSTVFGNGLPSDDGVLVSHSSNGGTSFSAPVFASPTAPGPKFGTGSDPFVAPDGTLYVAWHDFVANALVVAASTDGGRTFGHVHTIAPTIVSFAVLIPAQNVRGVLVYPACGADTSSGPDRGTLDCTWSDLTSNGDMDVFVSRSTDGGRTWSSPLRVNDDPLGAANDQFFPWLAIDPTTGSVNVSFYDTRGDPNRVLTNVFYARSTDGGRSFGPNVLITTAPTDETSPAANLDNQYGDYQGIAAYGGVVHPVWTDRRASLPASLGEEVFTSTITTG